MGNYLRPITRATSGLRLPASFGRRENLMNRGSTLPQSSYRAAHSLKSGATRKTRGSTRGRSSTSRPRGRGATRTTRSTREPFPSGRGYDYPPGTYFSEHGGRPANNKYRPTGAYYASPPPPPPRPPRRKKSCLRLGGLKLLYKGPKMLYKGVKRTFRAVSLCLDCLEVFED